MSESAPPPPAPPAPPASAPPASAAAPAPVATPPPAGGISGAPRPLAPDAMGFMTGGYSLLRGLGTIAGNPRLWPFAAAPIIIAAFAFTIGFAVYVWLLAPWVNGWFSTWNGWFWGPLAWVAEALLHVGVLLASFVASKTVLLPIVAGPFNEMLSEQVEYIQTGTKSPKTSFRAMLDDALPAAWRGVSTALFGLAVLLLFAPLLLIPGLGVVLYLVPTAYVEALAALDVTFARKKMPLGEKRAWMEARRAATVGLGAAILLGNLIPLGALVVVPSAAVAGTLLVVGEKKR